MTRSNNGEASHKAWHPHQWTVFGVVLAMIAIMQVSLGLFQVIAFTRQTNFINCQAEFNQQSSEARDARLGPAREENDSLYAWLESLPPLVSRDPNSQPTEGQIKEFTDTLDEAIRTHQRNNRAQKENPYPPEPEETCGAN